MRTKAVLATALIVVFLLLIISLNCSATSIKTKIFYKDIQRCNKFIDHQYDVLMAFLATLTNEDIEAINSQEREVEIYNSNAIDTFKKIKKMDTYYPKKVKYSNNSTEGLPRNFLASNFYRVTDYKGILKNYNIPEEDYEEALSKYSEYSVGLLDKLQELRTKGYDSGLKIYQLPKLNNIFINQCDMPLFLVDSAVKHPMHDSTYHAYETIYKTGWAWSVEAMPELYSNKNILTITKLWLEFLLNNDLTSSKWGDSYEEEVMTELDKIEKRLAKLSGGSEQKQKPAVKTEDIKPESAIPAPSESSKFKLDLPE